MAYAVSATDVAIKLAHRAGTLVIQPQYSHRFQTTYFTISDDVGLIEIADDFEAATRRVRDVVGSV